MRNLQDFEFTEHARDMLNERAIQEEWVWQTIDNPNKTEIGEDKNTHYYKTITEVKNRMLHIPHCG